LHSLHPNPKIFCSNSSPGTSSGPLWCQGYLGRGHGDEVRQPLPVNPLCSRPRGGSVTANLDDTRSASFHLTLISPPLKLSSAQLPRIQLTSRSPRKQGSLIAHLALTSQGRSSHRTYLALTSQAHSSQLTSEAHLAHLALLA
jgi:hypothetical protein